MVKKTSVVLLNLNILKPGGNQNSIFFVGIWKGHSLLACSFSVTADEALLCSATISENPHTPWGPDLSVCLCH